MKRILIGLIVAAVLAAGGWFGFNLYVQHRATSEVEAVFAQLRAGGGKASHGKIGFEVATRTLTIEDIAVEPRDQPQGHVKIGAFKSTGVRQIGDMRFAADGIDISGVEIALDEVGPGKLKVAYKIPQVTLRDYAGPFRVQNAPASSSLSEMYRFGLDQFASVTATSVMMPSINISFDAGSNIGGGEVVYSGLALQNLGRGKVDAMRDGPRHLRDQRDAAGKDGQADGRDLRHHCQ
ncbi:hypothetical protein [Bradyrhizobium sp. USDA 223]|uniref:hypothetical protein n=1 Tax=Bradyrhizobium sp. USDA 223 TaxID=3156306 RepID=UPI0038345CCD